MAELDGVLIDTDVLVIGAGAGGLVAALSAKRHGPPGTRILQRMDHRGAAG